MLAAIAGTALSASGLQPEQAGDVAGADQPEAELLRLDAFSEPVELKALVAFAAETLGINVTVDESLAGTVAFNAPVEIGRDELLPLIDSLLEPRGFSIVRDATGWYTVRRAADIPLSPAAAGSTTRILRTPNVRPSALQDIVQSQLNSSSVRSTFLDELGVIVLTGPIRQLEATQGLIEDLLARRAEMRFERLPLRFIAAPVARERAISLLSGSVSTSVPRINPAVQQNQNQNLSSAPDGSLDNLSDRLRIDQGDNALLFLGMPDELDEVRRVLELIDVATRLEPRRYQTGSSTANIAQIAVSQGLGEIFELQGDGTQSLAGGRGVPQQQFRPNQAGNQLNPTSANSVNAGGSRLIVDTERGYLVYYGTEPQQEQLAALIDQFDTDDEVIVVEAYKLQHANAVEVADILQGLIQNQRPTDSSDSGSFLLPQNQQGRPTNLAQNLSGDGGGEDAFTATEDESFVIADEANNQILVKAPQRQQREFARLIGRIDLRRPQVYIEARIVSMSDTTDSRLAFETQLFEIGGSQFSLTQNFGGLTFPADALESRSGVNVGAGFVGAILNPRQVPLLISALESDNIARTIAVPSLLVDDNEEASVATVASEPTTTTSQGGDTTQTSFGGFEDAETRLAVTPQISEGGYIRLEYEIRQQSFVGQGTDILPPARSSNEVDSGSVTIPSGTTVIIGGLNIDSETETVVKIPILGDIPLIGRLFRDESTGVTKQRLYVFLTPRILSEPTLEDYRLLTAGSLEEAGLPADAPTLQPRLIPIRVPKALEETSFDDLFSKSELEEVREDLESSDREPVILLEDDDARDGRPRSVTAPQPASPDDSDEG